MIMIHKVDGFCETVCFCKMSVERVSNKVDLIDMDLIWCWRGRYSTVDKGMIYAPSVGILRGDGDDVKDDDRPLSDDWRLFRFGDEKSLVKDDNSGMTKGRLVF